MMSAIGDTVHVLPVVNALKRHASDCRVTWVLQPGPASLIQGHPQVDEILIFERRPAVRAFSQIVRQLRSRRFDLLLDLQVSLKAGLITALSGAPVRLGFDFRRSLDLNVLFTNRRIPPGPHQHVQDQYFEFLRDMGVEPEPVTWNLGPWPEERPAQERFFHSIGRPTVALVIATSDPEKDWVPERWVELVDLLHEDFDLEPVLVGGNSPRERAIERLILNRARHKPISTLGRTSLRGLVGVLEGSALVISLDTGPMHMAVALDRPVIALMGYNNPKRVGPYRKFQDLVVDMYGEDGVDYPITRASRRHRMERIAVADVVEKVRLWEAKYRPVMGDGLARRAGGPK